MRVNVCSIRDAANNQKIADKKKADYQEGLEKSCANSAAWSRDSYMKDPEKSRARSCESYMKDPEIVVLTVQHEAVKVTRKTWRRVAMIVPWELLEGPWEKSCTKPRKLHEGSGKESCWQCSTKPQMLQHRRRKQILVGEAELFCWFTISISWQIEISTQANI